MLADGFADAIRADQVAGMPRNVGSYFRWMTTPTPPFAKYPATQYRVSRLIDLHEDRLALWQVTSLSVTRTVFLGSSAIH